MQNPEPSEAPCCNKGLCAVEAKGERLDLTLDSGAVRSCLTEDVAKDVPLHAVANPTVFSTAGGDSLTELGTKTPTLKFLGGDSSADQEINKYNLVQMPTSVGCTLVPPPKIK